MLYRAIIYHVCEVDKRVVDRHHFNSFLQRNTHHQTTNAAKPATDQTVPL